MKMTAQEFDNLTDNATHSTAAVWQKATGKPLTEEEMYQLNDLLTAFFGDRLE